MRAALLLSFMCIICGLAAFVGIPAVYVNAKPVFGVAGLATSLVFAVVPPLVVLGWRKNSRKQKTLPTQTYVPPNKSLERTREG
jgi:hypothetical protein